MGNRNRHKAKTVATPQPAPAAMPTNLQALVALEKERRAQHCLDELEAVLKKHNCYWQAVIILSGAQQKGQVLIQAHDQVAPAPAPPSPPAG